VIKGSSEVLASQRDSEEGQCIRIVHPKRSVSWGSGLAPEKYFSTRFCGVCRDIGELDLRAF
jgi:hypothetical protein